jgi:hypothetical protein
MPSINITNKPDLARVEIIPLDDAHRPLVPPLLDAQFRSLPPGSFILKNQRDKSITMVDVVWTYTDGSGHSVQRTLTCDGYYIGPVRPIVKAGNLSLITPSGYSSQEHFNRLPSTGVLEPLTWSAKDKSVLTDRIVSITLSLDSVLFEDGQIMGTRQSAVLRDHSKPAFRDAITGCGTRRGGQV